MRRIFLFTGLLLAASGRAQWVGIGPWGGNVQALAVDPQDPEALYAGTHVTIERPLSFRSTDGGASWHAGGSVEVHGVNGMVVDPHRSGTVYACTRDGALCRTTDAGLSWEPVALPGRAYAFVPDPFTAGRVHAAGFVDSAGLRPATFTSSDYGATWSGRQVDSAVGYLLCCACDPAVPGVIRAGGDRGRVYRSDDGGETWQLRGAGLSAGDTVGCLAVDPADPAVLVAGTETGIFRSTDSGETWQPVLGPSKVGDVAFGSPGTGVAYAWGRVGTVDRLCVSTDAGVTWTECGPAPKFTAASGIAVDPGAVGTAYVNTLVGILKTTDAGQTWQRADAGLGFADVHTIGVSPGDGRTVYVGADDCRVFRSDDAGGAWVQVNGFWCIENGMCCALAVAPRDSGHAVYGLEGGG